LAKLVTVSLENLGDHRIFFRNGGVKLDLKVKAGVINEMDFGGNLFFGV
jgi:hypothetical protein